LIECERRLSAVPIGLIEIPATGGLSTAMAGAEISQYFKTHASKKGQSFAVLLSGIVGWEWFSSIAIDAGMSVDFAHASAASGSMATETAIRKATSVRAMLMDQP